MNLKSSIIRVTELGGYSIQFVLNDGTPLERYKIDDGPWLTAEMNPDNTQLLKPFSLDWPNPTAGEHTGFPRD